MFLVIIVLSVGGFYAWMKYTDSTSAPTSSSGATKAVPGSKMNYVDFDGEGFVPSTISIKTGDGLGITNKSATKAMSLTSTYSKITPAVNVPYGYIYEMNFGESGRFLIINKDKPSKTLEVIVN